MFTGIRLRLVENASLVRKKWSFIFNSVATTILGYLVLTPDAIINLWNSLPDEVKGLIPPKYVFLVPLVLYVLGLISQYIKQQKLTDAKKELDRGSL